LSLLEKIQGGVFGLAVGDALGVPVEFNSRAYLRRNPVKDLMGYGTWNQPLGTWSDDTSLTLCLCEALTIDYDLESIGKLFVKWYKEAYWSAHNEVFDIGLTTRESLDRISKGESAKFSGNFFEENNGNGSLMRILPLVYYLKDVKDLHKIYTIVKEVSSITHAHFRSCFSCLVYCVLCIHILNGDDKEIAYQKMQLDICKFIKENNFNLKELTLFNRIVENKVWILEEKDINSSGYVLDSLEAALWSFYLTDSYEQAVLKAVNLGKDTDTIAAITGGLAGLYYGFDSIPEFWKFRIARFDDIQNLVKKFENKIEENEIKNKKI
jgi:ADP-ribosylglycohydrolase